MKRAVLAVSVTVAMAAMARPASAYDDGYQNVFSSVLGAVGVMPQDKSPDIDYRERPPLVLPPKQVLVKPETPGARRTAAWPSDPDVVRRRKEAEEAKAPVFEFDKSGDRAMPKEEMLKYRAAQKEDVAPSGCNVSEHSMAKCRSNPDEMKAEEARFQAANPEKAETVTAGVEPDREYLTQPPKGYMKATQTVLATHEAPVKKRDTSSPLSTYIHPVDNKSIDPLNN